MNIDSKVIIAKEEINLALYIYKKTFNKNQKKFFKSLRSPKFWLNFENRGYWKNYNTTAK